MEAQRSPNEHKDYEVTIHSVASTLPLFYSMLDGARDQLTLVGVYLRELSHLVECTLHTVFVEPLVLLKPICLEIRLFTQCPYPNCSDSMVRMKSLYPLKTEALLVPCGLADCSHSPNGQVVQHAIYL